MQAAQGFIGLADFDFERGAIREYLAQQRSGTTNLDGVVVILQGFESVFSPVVSGGGVVEKLGRGVAVGRQGEVDGRPAQVGFADFGSGLFFGPLQQYYAQVVEGLPAVGFGGGRFARPRGPGSWHRPVVDTRWVNHGGSVSLVVQRPTITR